MEEFPYDLRQTDFEIFPEEICRDTFVVFHGTCMYHDHKIGKGGLSPNNLPFDIDYIRKLIETLRFEQVSHIDFEGDRPAALADYMQGHIECIDQGEWPISFFGVSSQCIEYTQGDKRGGQFVQNIRKAKQIIDLALERNSLIISLIPTEVNLLFKELHIMSNSLGVVYAVRLYDDLQGVECDEGILYSHRPLDVSRIIGKVIIPKDLGDLGQYREQIEEQMIKKLYTARGLARRIQQLNNV